MWKNTYKDYKPNEQWVQQTVEPGKGVIGCEMHELNGWGEKQHTPRTKKKGVLRLFLRFVFKRSS
jgi:hypothetical protein